MIIGIVGFLGSGKDTVGDTLYRDYGFQKESFAKPLKDAAASIFGWDRHMIDGTTSDSRKWREEEDVYWATKLNRPGFTPRLALQLLGTQAGREVFGEELWTASCIKRCQGQSTNDATITHYVITDARFKNEIKAIKDANGVVIRVKRGPEPEWYKAALSYMESYPYDFSPDQKLASYMSQYNMNATKSIHESEWDWVGSEFDYVLENDKTLADLKQSIYDIMVDLRLTHKPPRRIELGI